ncbi:Wzz/FepE/Etk N-terminal domain-containing protein [Povalibacter sp.]|uniref:Wzz/FepE/Etk N-terminal domain-containing protein n=1 Tax=Povalibacter sp. TaxID=1962978 RepID=UPI002F428A23
MSQIHEERTLDGDEIDMRELVAALWKRKYVVAAVTIVCGLLAFGSSYLFKRKYESAVVFVTLTDDAMGGQAGGLAALASQIGGLASLGGLSLSGNERKAEYLAILQSQALIERFITQNNLMPVLYVDSWDEARSAWKEADPKRQPTTWKAMQRFKSEVMRLNTVNKTGISTLSISWSDANVGARWANGLVEMANEHVRARTIAEAELNVAYLNRQLTKTSVVAVQNSISTLLENQIKKIMLAQGTDQYAFRVIDPALPPERASFPKRIVWGVLGAFVGLMGSIAFVILGRAWRYWNQYPAPRE